MPYSFHTAVSYPLKTSDNQRLSDIFWEYRKRSENKLGQKEAQLDKLKSDFYVPLQQVLVQVSKAKTDAIMFC